MEIELDAFTAISFVASNVNTNGDLSGLVHDCRDLLPKLPQVKLSTASGTQNFAPMPYPDWDRPPLMFSLFCNTSPAI